MLKCDSNQKLPGEVEDHFTGQGNTEKLAKDI
jgi:hypothetical protein